ncbi:terminase small subunit [Chachezhania sediminis]|uniref:terminase small subunit n=1 Tax=Chachezhania sediminis TaxID=2599291 RepID=UPI00131D9BFC|nr:terminase small subunit [Chachezhania sediminis]
MTDGTEAPPLLDVAVDDDLLKLLRKYPLPAKLADTDMNQEEIGQAFDVSVNTVSKWIREGMPVAQVGGNGRAYVLRLSHCWAWRRSIEADSAARTKHNENQISMLRAELLGVEIDSQAAQLSARERRELAEADMRWSEAQRKRRQLVPLTDVLDLLEALGRIVRNGIEAMPDRLERELDLTPAQVAAVKRAGDDMLTTWADEIDEAELRERDVADAELGASLMI